jgi:tetratricopeptide (TPR) repeat protein
MSGISNTRPRGGRLTSLISGILLLGPWSSLLLASDCANPVAQAVSVQGRVEVRTENQQDWTPVVQYDRLCPGDHLRVGAHSRAALSLNDDSLLRLTQHSTIRISAPREDGSAWLDLLEGITHFISRVRGGFQVNSPYVNASVEGTEFTVEAAQDEGSVTVLEGRVRATNQQGEVVLGAGQRATAAAGRAPSAAAVVDPLDAVQWALYYPPVVAPSAGNASPAVDTSYKAYREGDLVQAFAALEQVDDLDQNPDQLTYRAALLLRVGEVNAAQRDLDAALSLSPEHPEALALKSIIASVRSQRQQAINLAQRATQSSPASATALLALSYAYQGNFQLEKALDAAEEATRVAPDNALAWSRLAELQLMFRRLDGAVASADHAASLAPELAQVQTTLGFARLIRLDLSQAREAFKRAAQTDQAAPLPRLGLGLVLIRQGDLDEGRREIETAANLDPGNALIRSYLGKAYYEEKRDDRAAAQFELAKDFDELDPTAWFYDAILKRSQNRPQEALVDLQTAIDLNDNRAVYRSRLLLDEDQAARSASLANIYGDLGFDRLALKESAKSLVADPGNASAHRFLAESYVGVTRHEIARVSEQLRAQMLTPEIVNPVSPSASEAELLTFQDSGPALAGYNEFNPLFNRQRLTFQASGFSGSKNTRGNEITVGGFTKRGMLSAGYYKESSDGFFDNNDSEQEITNLFGQLRLSSSLSLQGEIKHRENEHGFLPQIYDEDYFLAPLVRRERDADSERLGLNYTPNQNHTLLISAVNLDLNTQDILPGNLGDTDEETRQYEAQYIYNTPQMSVTAGMGRTDLESDTLRTLTFIGPFGPIILEVPSSIDLDQQTAYVYLNHSGSWGSVVVGADHVKLDFETSYTESQTNPKLGLVWNLSPATVLRLAGFKTVRSQIANNWTIAPTEVVGFNQIYDDFIGTQAKRYASALDHRFHEDLDAGVQFSRRVITRFSDELTGLDEEQVELDHKAYLYWQIIDRLSLGATYGHEKYQRTKFSGTTNPLRPATLETDTFRLSGAYFHPSGFSAELATSHVAQTVDVTGASEEDDSFWITDTTLGYRFPNRWGSVKFQVKNLFDKEFRYQSTFPGTGTQVYSPYTPERAYYLYLTALL